MQETMASLLEQESVKEFNQHDVIVGEVVQVEPDVAYVNINYKMDIPIQKKELAFPEPASAMDVVKVGDKIKVYVVAIGGENGVTLSKVRADRLTAWEDVAKLMDEKKTIEVEILDVVKGGLTTNACGLRGFIPASQIDLHFVKDLNEYKGKKLEVLPIEVDPKKQRFVLSHRAVLEKQRDKMREEALASIVPGEKRTGVVKRLVDYGAFIDIGGIDGLAHISDLSWEHVKNPAEVLSVGDKVEVLIKSFEPETKRISLSIKDTMRDPWLDKAEKYPVGSIVTGKIVKLTDFGAFMEIEPGFDGLIRMRELAPRHINKASEVVNVGDEVKVKVIHVDMDNKKVALSITRVQQDAEKAEYKNYLANQEKDAVTIGEEVK